MAGIDEKLRKTMLYMMTVVLSFLFLSYPVHAENSTLSSGRIDPGETGSITINRAWDSEWPVTGTVFHLYKVADLNDDLTFSYTEKFAEKAAKISLPVADQTENSTWENTRNALKKLIDENNIEPDESANWNTREGDAVFRKLKTGLYLVTSDEITFNGTEYVSSGNLIPLPRRDSDKNPWEYGIEVEMKHTEEPVTVPASPVPSVSPSPRSVITPTPETVKPSPSPTSSIEKPDTGDHFHFWIYTVVLIATGAVIGVVIYIRTKERKD